MSQSHISNQSGKKYNALSEEHLTRTQTKLVPLLTNPEYLTRLKKLIEKYETLNSADIENYLYSKIHRFNPKTQHKIRDFIVRVEKSKQNSNNSDKSLHSDNSNFISPSSRESFSSRSNDSSDSNFVKNTLQNDVMRLWKYPVCQKEMCELLYSNGDLEVCSKRSVAIDFQCLKPSSVRALTDYLSIKSALIHEIRKDQELYLLFQILAHETFDEETTRHICDILFRYENVAPNPNGFRSIEITSLKSETKRMLLKLLQPKYTSPKTNKAPSPKTINDSNLVTAARSKIANESAKNVPTNNTAKDGINVTDQDAHFTKEKLHFLYKNITESLGDERLTDIMKIINASEDINEKDDSMKLNVKKFKNVTKNNLYKYFTETVNKQS